MKIGVVTESSTKDKNAIVCGKLEAMQGLRVINAGMKGVCEEPTLSYLDTGFMTALLLNMGLVDFVVGGCGTGQGFFNAALQYPNVFCGLLLDPTDAFLFSRVNAGNCVSLSLNKGFALGGEFNLELIFQNLFAEPFGLGYPDGRREVQADVRMRLAALSGANHLSFHEILERTEDRLMSAVLDFPGFWRILQASADEEGLRILERKRRLF